MKTVGNGQKRPKLFVFSFFPQKQIENSIVRNKYGNGIIARQYWLVVDNA